MNLWVVKLGGNITGNEVGEIERIAEKYKTLEFRKFTQFKSPHLHYISYSTMVEHGGKRYNTSDDDQLIAFSGLPVAGKSIYHDYRDVRKLKKYIENYGLANRELLGQYAFLRVLGDKFECFPDFMGIHKIFFTHLPSGAVLVSNSVLCIQCIKGTELNHDFYVNWISSGEIYGYETEDKKIYTVPEFSHVKWSVDKGFNIQSHDSFSSLILPQHELEYYVTKTASDFKNSIHYLTDFHSSVLPLSGGYDSRLILETFSLFDTSGLKSYTYPDVKEDVKYAKKVATYHKVNHTVLKPEKRLNEIEVSDSLFFPGDAFLDYSKVFGFQFRKQKKQFCENGLKVLLKGDGAGTHAILRKYSEKIDGNPLEAINYIVDKLFTGGILIDDVEEHYRRRMKNYYEEKYLNIVRKSEATHAFASINYFFERFGNYQSHKLINGYQLNDMYLPYANRNFIKAVFLSSQSKLSKNRKQSLHHLLHKEILGHRTKPIHFANGIHWEANKLQRIYFRIRKMAEQELLKSNSKYSKTLRDLFFEKNKNFFKEVIYSSSKHEFWNYFDYHKLKIALESDNISARQRKAIFKIVPLLQKYK